MVGTGGSTQPSNGTTLSVQVPFGARLHNIVLGATDSLTVSDGVLIQSTVASLDADLANTGSGTTELGADTVVSGDVYSVGSPYLRQRATITGNLTTQGQLSTQGTWTIGGETQQGVPLGPVKSYTWDVSFPPAQSGMTVEPQQTQQVLPGSYAMLAVQPFGKARLSAGTYYFGQFQMESNSTLLVNADDGPVIIYVHDALTYRGTVTGTTAAHVFIGYVGQALANLDAPFKGTVVAPNALLRLGPVDGSGHEGSFFARSLLVEARNPVRYVPFAHWDWLLPPKLILECLSRSGSGYGAGVFGYRNELDIDVRIPEGPRNSISSNTRRAKGPLQVFAQGERRNAFWLPFRGSSITWTLSGHATVVDDSVPRCTPANYRFSHVASPQAEVLAPLPQSLVQRLAPPGQVPAPETPSSATPVSLTPSLLTRTPEPGIPSVPFQRIPNTRHVRVWVYGMSLGSECSVGEYDVDGIVTVNGQTIQQKLFDGVWSMLASGRAILGKAFDFDLPADASEVDVALDVWERDGAVCGGDDHLFSLPQHIDLSTVSPITEIEPPQTVQNIATTGDGWIIYRAVQSSRPSLCAAWPVQYLDSNVGEDRLATIERQEVPASYAHVRMSVSGSRRPFQSWPDGTYVILDENGCLPDQFAPTFDDLVPADPTAGVSVSLQWLGALSVPADAQGNRMTVVIERSANGDPWTACGCTGVPFFKEGGPLTGCNAANQPTCSYPSNMSMIPAIMTRTLNSRDAGVDVGELRFKLGTLDDNPTDFSGAAGFASVLLKLAGTGEQDMGLTPRIVHIWPESVNAFVSGSLYAHQTNNASNDQYLEFRPRWYSMNGDDVVGHESDSNRKVPMAHEFGHAVHGFGSGDVGNGFYSPVVQDRDSTADENLQDPESLPPECRCLHIGDEYMGWHCMDSLERIGAASAEGFAHFYSNRLWNNPKDTSGDCWMPYSKDGLMPECPTKPDGTPATRCVQLSSTEGQQKVQQLYTDPVDQQHLIADRGSWFFVEGPVLIRCGDPTRWRNHYCVEDVTGVPLVTTPDVAEMGVEMDWMQFNWSLTRGQDAWKISDFFALQRAACNNRLCEWTDEHSLRAWVKYEELTSLAQSDPGSLPAELQAMTLFQWNLLRDMGREHGVSTDLAP